MSAHVTERRERPAVGVEADSACIAPLNESAGDARALLARGGRGGAGIAASVPSTTAPGSCTAWPGAGSSSG